MSLTIHCKYKYFDSTVKRAEDRRQKFYFIIAVNVKLNLSIVNEVEARKRNGNETGFITFELPFSVDSCTRKGEQMLSRIVIKCKFRER